MMSATRADAIVIEGDGAANEIDVSSQSVSHYVYGRGGADSITGSSAGDLLDGGYGYDRLYGGPADDTLIGGPGDDILDGGAGIDRARFARSLASYKLSGSQSEFRIQAISGNEGTDTVSNVEYLVFADETRAVASLFESPGGVEPVAGDDSAETLRDEPVVIELLANDIAADGETLHIAWLGQPEQGVVFENPDGSVTYAPAASFVGTDEFQYVVRDGQGRQATGIVTVIVRAPTMGDALLQAIAAAQEGSWIRVNGNRFEDVWTPVQQRAEVNGVPIGDPRKIITAWGSMTWDSNRRTLLIWGGGHANYAGNDVYGFDATTLRWQRAALPSAVHAPFGDRRFLTVDGALNAPISSHTYDNQEFLPLADRLITFGGASYNAGAPFVLDDGVTRTGPYLWDPSRAGADMVGGTSGSQVRAAIFPNVIGGRMWQNRDALVTNGIGAQRPGSFVNGTSAYVVENGLESLLVSESPSTGGDLFRYRIVDVGQPALDRWDLVGPGLKGYSHQGAGAYDPVRRVYLRTAKVGTAYGIVMWNVATPGPTNHPIKFVPPNANGQFLLSKLHGMDFDSRRGLFVLWNGDGRVWQLRPPASGPAFTASGWTVTEAPVSGTDTPALTSSTGVLGKWKYLNSHDAMIGLGDGIDGQVWIYKPEGWQAP